MLRYLVFLKKKIIPLNWINVPVFGVLPLATAILMIQWWPTNFPQKRADNRPGAMQKGSLTGVAGFSSLNQGYGPMSALFARGKKYQYIGSYHCRKCHYKRSGNQYGQWRTSAHKKAYQALRFGGERLAQVKKEYKINDAHKDKRCLLCHTSGRKKLLVNVLRDGRKIYNYEGVGCEACHGPAEKYIDPGIHLSPAADRKQVKRQHGMWAILGDSSIRLRERMCMRCHRKNRLCNIPGARGAEISLPVIANFRHDLKY